SSGVTARPDRRAAGRDESGLAAAAPARSAGEVGRIVRVAVYGIIVTVDRLGEHDPARRAYPHHDSGIVARNIALPFEWTGCADDARRFEPVLNRAGDPVQLTGDLAARERRV